jgi:hypothetical protein
MINCSSNHQTGVPLRPVLRVRPLPQESIWGWALRASECNRYRNSSWILKEVGFLPPLYESRSTVLRRLAAMSGASPSVFEKLIPERCGKGFGKTPIPGLDLPPWFIETRSARVCPDCLKENEVARKGIHRTERQPLQFVRPQSGRHSGPLRENRILNFCFFWYCDSQQLLNSILNSARTKLPRD